MNAPFALPKTPWRRSLTMPRPWFFVGKDEDSRKQAIDAIKQKLIKLLESRQMMNSVHSAGDFENGNEIVLVDSLHLAGSSGIGKTALIDVAVDAVFHEQEGIGWYQFGVVLISGLYKAEAVHQNGNELLTKLVESARAQLLEERSLDKDVRRSEDTNNRDQSWQAAWNGTIKELSRRNYVLLVIVIQSVGGKRSQLEQDLKGVLPFIGMKVENIGLLIICETHDEKSIEMPSIISNVQRSHTAQYFPEEPQVSSPHRSNHASRTKPIIIKKLSRKNVMDFIWVKDTGYRRPYYDGSGLLFYLRRVWISWVVQQFAGRHPLLLHMICYKLDLAFQSNNEWGWNRLRNVLINSVEGDISNQRHVEYLKESLRWVKRDLKALDRYTCKTAWRWLKEQGLVKWNLAAQEVCVSVFVDDDDVWNRPSTIKSWLRKFNVLGDGILDYPTDIGQDERYNQAICAVLGNSGSKIGTGFIVEFEGDIYVVTCGHVLSASNWNDRTGQIELLNGFKSSVKVILFDKPNSDQEGANRTASEDIAVLEIVNASIDRDGMPMFIPSYLSSKNRCPCHFFAGYAQISSKRWQKNVRSGNEAGSGMIELVLQCPEKDLKGSSGAPVYWGAKEYIIGMVRAHDLETKNAYLIPAHAIVQKIEEAKHAK